MRPTWHETWMKCAQDFADMSYDPRYKVGCVIVPDDNTSILALGFNGNAHGLPNVPDSEEPGKSGFVHAEQNAFYKLNYTDPRTRVMYVTMSPCEMCAKGAIQARISRVIYRDAYRDATGIQLLRRVGIEVASLEELLKP